MNQYFIDKKIKPFYKDKEHFLKLCEERGIFLGNGIFEYYQAQNFIAPLQIEEKKELYDPIQVFYIAELEKIKQKSLLTSPAERVTWQDELKKYEKNIGTQFEKFKPIFQLLQFLRYFYFPKITGQVTIPEDSFTLEEWRTDCKNFDFKLLLAQFNLSPEDVDNWRALLLMKGADIDPSGNFSDWFFFFSKVRHVDYKKSLLLTGSLLLAQDYYVMAEMLTKLLQAVKPKGEVLPIEFLLDAKAGRWRKSECAECGNKFARKSAGERYCEKCKKDLSKTLEGAWVCQNKECNAFLYKFQDNNELTNTLFPAGGKKSAIENSIRLEYGLLTVTCKCKCGQLNVKKIWQGWWPDLT